MSICLKEELVSHLFQRMPLHPGGMRSYLGLGVHECSLMTSKLCLRHRTLVKRERDEVTNGGLPLAALWCILKERHAHFFENTVALPNSNV